MYAETNAGLYRPTDRDDSPAQKPTVARPMDHDTLTERVYRLYRDALVDVDEARTVREEERADARVDALDDVLTLLEGGDE